MSRYTFTATVTIGAIPPLYSFNGTDKCELMSRAPLRAIFWMQSLLLRTRKRNYYTLRLIVPYGVGKNEVQMNREQPPSVPLRGLRTGNLQRDRMMAAQSGHRG
jgi:hypothetical protein